MSINEDTSFIKYLVDQPTQDFVTNFDTIGGTTDVVLVTVDGVLTDTPESSYAVQQINHTTWRVTPEVQTGSVVRLYRVTIIDEMMHVFTAGAKFIARNMDNNFKQIRHAQQEVRDDFNKLSVDTNEIIDTLQVVGQAAQDAADAAEQAAVLANDAAAQVSDKVPKSTTLPTYLTVAAGVDPVTGVLAGAYFNVRSSSDESFMDEYQNVGGSAVATGKSYPSGLALSNVSIELNKVNGKAYRDNETIYDYGAVGDGTLHTIEEWYTIGAAQYRGYSGLVAVQIDYPFVTDKDFSVDQAAILKLAKIKGDAGGGTVDLSQGHYYLKPINNGACLSIPPKVTLKGHREDTILHEHTALDDDPNTSVYWDLVVFTGGLNVGGGINNCTIRHSGGRRNNTASIAVRGGASRKKIFGNIMENAIGSSIALEYSVSNPKPLACQVFDNYINPTSRHGVYIIGATANKVYNNDFNISALESIAVRASGNNSIYENNFFGVAESAAHAITLAAPPAGVGGYKYVGLSIKNNKAFGIRGAFFYGQGVGCQLSESEISGNYINQSIEADVTAHDLMLYRTTNTKIKDNILDGGRNRGVILYGCQGNDITGNTFKNLNEAGNSVGIVFLTSYTDSYDSTTTYSTWNNIKSNKFIDDRGVQRHAHVIQMLAGNNKNYISKNNYVGGASAKIQSADGLSAQNIGEVTDSFLFTKADMALGTVPATTMRVGGNSSSEYATSDSYIKEVRLTISQVLTAGTVTARLYKNGSAIIANVFTANGSLRTNQMLFQPQQYTVNNGDLFTVTIESNGTTSAQSQVDASVSVVLAE